MRACHAFFEEAHLSEPLMLAELQAWFPLRADLPLGEVAGLTTADAARPRRLGDAAGTPSAEDLLVLPLEELLERIRWRHAPAPLLLLVTFAGHTRLVLSEAPQRMQLFDPLVGALCPLVHWNLPPRTQYAGLLMSPAV
jgi:hypothetical protein